ncbi:conjugative transfer signal peptidase TraF [Shinella sp. CPCC 101442]|uniref:conjugative transfer signal peptidase TraF n=1 Tax=Shinella sp. CPCC 101442 TaxID=2932265 RepID=UPI00215361E0|nr:conjugative transfer signal peptidase TraF [Shinella sp. CPCC 101442]MCR6502074.1 conjugative transfer signal peptidase TraF [Shinella sp. CPCC 101442]
MTVSIESVAPYRRRRAAVSLLGAAAVVMFTGIVGLGVAGFRVNLTPSEPLGLWQIQQLDRPIQVSDLVFVCPPVSDIMLNARARGYLRHGLCAGGLAPLIKTVAAISGQRIEVSDLVRIDGHSLPHAKLMQRDGQGRRMLPYGGGIIPPGAVYLHSDFRGSFDSRYFGPLSTKNVLGLAREVWTYAP